MEQNFDEILEEAAQDLKEDPEPNQNIEEDIFSQLTEGFQKSLEETNFKEENPNQLLESLVKELGNELEQNPELQEGLGDFMQSLFSKEMLLQPVLEVKEKYLEILKQEQENEETKHRYQKQFEVYQKLEEELKGEGNKEKVIQLTAELQDYGDPPPQCTNDCSIF